MSNPVPVLIPRLVCFSADVCTGRSAIGTVGTAEFSEEFAAAGGGAGGFAEESLAPVAAAAGAALWAL